MEIVIHENEFNKDDNILSSEAIDETDKVSF